MASVFAGVWRSIKAHEFTHYWFKGGRNSTKSSFISIAIVLLTMLNPEANAVVLRKVGNTLRTSSMPSNSSTSSNHTTAQ